MEGHPRSAGGVCLGGGDRAQLGLSSGLYPRPDPILSFEPSAISAPSWDIYRIKKTVLGPHALVKGAISLIFTKVKRFFQAEFAA